MRLTFKQKSFSWLGSYNVYDDEGKLYCSIEGELATRHKFTFCQNGKCIAKLDAEYIHLIPNYKMFIGDKYAGRIVQDCSNDALNFHIEDNEDFQIVGEFWRWDYVILKNGSKIASVSKEIMYLIDTYSIDVYNDDYAIMVLMIALAIDAIKDNNERKSREI